ncbi:hypothetical protein [Kitasatospora sp. NPDC057936]|uniref:hypothetical protein n=1 Tax=Kitasatospora sp. NPDC057936 TaxID=3346283 RepID=UPI0036D9A356
MTERADRSVGGSEERVLNPLWIISLFLGLAEITVGVAATQAQGWIQGVFALFSVLFPSAVAVGFFRILFSRPFVLYAPKDYPNPPSMEAYVAALSSAAVGNRENVDAAVRAAVEGVVIPRLPSGSGQDANIVIEQAVRAAREDLESHSVTVDLSGIDLGLSGQVLDFPADTVTVANLLDVTYLSIHDYVDAYTYGRQWVLRNPTTGQTFVEIGTQDQGRDGRKLQEVGIRSGDRLLAVRTAKRRR